MTANNRFLRLVRSCLEHGAQARRLSENQFLLFYEGRDFHLFYASDRDEVSVASMVFFANGDALLIDAQFVAAFNAWRLFHGGDRMAVDAKTQSIYVSGSKALVSLERVGLGGFLEDFAYRCAAYERVYREELYEKSLNELVAKVHGASANEVRSKATAVRL